MELFQYVTWNLNGSLRIRGLTLLWAVQVDLLDFHSNVSVIRLNCRWIEFYCRNYNMLIDIYVLLPRWRGGVGHSVDSVWMKGRPWLKCWWSKWLPRKSNETWWWVSRLNCQLLEITEKTTSLIGLSTDGPAVWNCTNATCNKLFVLETEQHHQ
jgi:hypothetical protein